MNLHVCNSCDEEWVMSGVPMFCPSCGYEMNMDWDEFVEEISRLGEEND